MIFVDTHVHIYDCFDLKLFLSSAFHNFQLAENAFSPPSAFALILTESGTLNYFSRLQNDETRHGKDRLFEKAVENYKIESLSHEANAVKVSNSYGASFYIIAGRQIITREKLEVLALFTNTFFDDNRPVDSVIESISSMGGIPVLPWSPGKWMGKRRAVIKKLIESKAVPTFFLGDIFGRPSFYTEPLFQSAEKQNIRILTGSDPLPLKGEEKRVGCCMSAISGELDNKAPVTHLKELIQSPETEMVHFGRQTGVFNFFKNQLLLRIAKLRK